MMRVFLVFMDFFGGFAKEHDLNFLRINMLCKVGGELNCCLYVAFLIAIC